MRKIRNLVTNAPSSVKIARNAEITGYQHLHPDKAYTVAKIGRTAGWTTGRVNAIGSTLCIRKDFASVVPVEFKKNDNKFDDVILVFGILADDDTVAFVAPGDSGSVVLLNDGSSKKEGVALGLGFAGNSATSMSYMMPMSHIIRDIENITGAKVMGFPDCGTAEGEDLARRRVLDG